MTRRVAVENNAQARWRADSGCEEAVTSRRNPPPGYGALECRLVRPCDDSKEDGDGDDTNSIEMRRRALCLGVSWCPYPSECVFGRKLGKRSGP